jgi:hypothetical protein
MSDYKVCKICVMMKGLKGSDLFDGKCEYAFKTDDEFMDYLEKEHHYKIIDRPKKKE